MKIILKIVIVATAIFILALPVLADEITPVQVSFVDIDPAAAQDSNFAQNCLEQVGIGILNSLPAGSVGGVAISRIVGREIR